MHCCNCLPSDTSKSKLAGVVLCEDISEPVVQAYCSSPSRPQDSFIVLPTWRPHQRRTRLDPPSEPAPATPSAAEIVGHEHTVERAHRGCPLDIQVSLTPAYSKLG